MSLSDSHRQLLLDAAITQEVIDTCGAETTEQGLSFLYRGPDGEESRQLKPDNPTKDANGRPMKYLFPRGTRNFMNIIRDTGRGTVLIVEGTKQALAAASWAPSEYAVIGLSGSTMWHKHDWDFVDGRDVLVCFDGDAATNRDVYNQAEKFGKELKDEGADSVLYVRIPLDDDTSKTGLDDFLSDTSENRRARVMAKLLDRAENKPADHKPRAKDRSTPQQVELPESGGRDIIAVNGDLKTVTENLLQALKTRWDGHYMFNYGRALTCIEGPSTVPLEDGDLLRLLSDTVMMVYKKEATSRTPEKYEVGGRPDGQTMKILMSSFRDFTELHSIVRFPFFRPNGTVCTTAGYDESTKTVLVDTPVLSQISVPESPSAEELRAAVELLMEDWMADMPFPTPTARANALALILTPFVRNLFPLVPLAVVNGLQMGVGKNLFVDCIAMLTTGQWAAPMPYVQSEEETRKQITAAFRSGTEIIAFDEAHVLEGAQLARALTSVTYQDRELGQSRMIAFPNTVTWMSMGNQVQVNGDISRRVYWVDLSPTGANPQDRDADTFLHPDLKGWTEENRGRLVSAALTVIRSWFVAGQPSAPRGSTLGSFEQWDKAMGGIVAHAGLEGFLGDIQEKRSETDFDGAHWLAHIQWLYETFGATEFTTADVKREATQAITFEAPPGMEDTTGKDYSRQLGRAYGSKIDRWYGDLKLIKTGIGHRSVVKWAIVKHREDRPEGYGGLPISPPYVGTHTILASNKESVCAHIYKGGMDTPPHPSEETPTNRVEGDTPACIDTPEQGGTGHTMTAFDLETCSVDEKVSRPDFVRLGKVEGHPSTTDMAEMINQLEAADRITGHNILNFDLWALARHHGADYEKLAAKSFDTIIAAMQLDPPMAKGMPRGYYGLNSLAERLGVPMKTDDIKRLAKKHGGFDSIPVDDEEYVSYLEGDVTASQAVSEALREKADADPYIAREHAVAAIMGRMSLNGFAIDEEYTRERYQAGQDKLNAMRDKLHREYGFPNTGAAPQRTLVGKKAFYDALRGTGLGPTWIENNWKKNEDKTLSLAKEVLLEKVEVLRGAGRVEAAEMCEVILAMNGVRTVYGNLLDWLVDGRVHPNIFPEQSTGRWSIKDPGLTVLGKRGGKVVERGCATADPGELLICFDADQIDMRMVAAHSGDRNYAKLFLPKADGTLPDAHQMTADLFGMTREAVKPCNHGANYGISVSGLVRNGVPQDIAERFLQQSAEQFPARHQWMQDIRAIGESGAFIDNGFGRKMRCNPERAYTQAPALAGQGGTRDVMAQALLNLPKHYLPRLRAVIHDEVVISVPADSVEDVKREVIEAFTMEFKGIPITWGSSKAAFRWSDCYGG